MKYFRSKNIISILLFFLGLSILFYPLISDKWNTYRDQTLLVAYDKEIKHSSKKDVDKIWEAAKKYNKALGIQKVPDAFSVREDIKDRKYESSLNIGNNQVMGYIDIPSIKVNIPIYHYTTDSSLSKGAGHLFGSALPVGGEGTHTVISAHRGLPSAKLFTDLPLVKKGDYFYFHILNHSITYKVDKIIVVKPYQVETLAGARGKDYATLITCTPYGVNTKRLLVRGHRVPYNKDKHNRESNKNSKVDTKRLIIQCIAGISGIILALAIFNTYKFISKNKNS